MDRKTLGITTALVSVAATGTPAANAAPQPVNPLLAKTAALHAVAEQTRTISAALGLSGGEQLIARDVVRDADGTHHLRFDRTLNGLKVIGGDLVVTQKAGQVTSVTKASQASLSGVDTTATEFHAANAADVGDYLIGEKINIRGDGKPLRYMDKPSKDGRSLDYWSASAGSVDVHHSSGIANHFFYLLAEGSGQKTINGVAYDSPTVDNQPVTGIGRAKAEKIWYRALTTKFTSSTKYAAAADLYGATSAEYAAVNRAWAAVNVK